MERWDRRREMYGEWLAESDEEKALRELAETYHTLCNVYDDSVCSGISPWTGEIMPINPLEASLINIHAREVRKRLMITAYEKGISEEQMSDAIKRYCK